MAGGSSDRVVRQLHRVFNLGAVGTMSDAELLEWFLTDRMKSGETAFEEFMNRHGPMVFGVCRRVLQDRHDAEDAYQAVFLVLGQTGRLNSPARVVGKLALRCCSPGRKQSQRPVPPGGGRLI